MKHLKNKTVLITGGARGIGKAIALEFARHGSDIIICDLDKSFFDKNEFILVDSIKKKIKAVNSIVNSLSLNNVQLINMRMENISIKSDLIICRGVSSIIKILKWSKKSIKKRKPEATN